MEILNFVASLIGAILSLRKTLFEKKSIVMIGVYLFCFIFTSGLAIWNGSHLTISVMEHCSLSEGNVTFESGGMNILIRPKYKVNDVEGLKIKDTIFSLQKNEDYELLPSGLIKIRWIYNNNYGDNKNLAQHGFALSYKAKFSLFNLIYWKLKLKKS